MIPREDLTPEDAAEALREVLESVGWQRVMRPALEERLRLARARLEDCAAETLERDGRAMQAEIRLLRGMVEQPREAFRR